MPSPDQPASSELAKVRALALPIRTIKDFLEWVRRTKEPTLQVNELNVDELLYEYYNVDVYRLAIEVAAELQCNNPKPEG